MTQLPNEPRQRNRILGDQRIFQSIYNDLALSHKLNHELLTLSDGREVWAYTYSDVDPYDLEDDAFPETVKAIAVLIRQRDDQTPKS